MNKLEILNILEQNNLSPNKKFGQNFLCNDDIVSKIVESASLSNIDNILEIGPGLGCMTEKMVKKANKVTAVEIDNGLYKFLSEKFSQTKNIDLIHNDILKIKLEKNYNKIIANLPYYCASEIMFKCAVNCEPELMIVMIQKEMADRIFAKAGDENYGALTATLKYYFEPEILFNVDKKSFYPQPDVVSTVIKLNYIENRDLNKNERELFHLIVKSAFWGRRKTILKSLSDSPHINYSKKIVRDTLEKIGIDLSLRAEKLSTEDYISITKEIIKEK